MPERDVEIARLFEPGQEAALEAYVRLLHPTDVAALFNLIDEEHWLQITKLLSSEDLAEVLADLDEPQVEIVGDLLGTERLIEAFEELETDDAADVIAELTDEKAEAVLEGLEEEDREDITELLAYPEDSAGGIMQTELCLVDENARVKDAIEAVRLAYEEVEDILEVYTVDAAGRPTGTVALEDLVISKPDRPISEVSEPFDQTVTPEVDQEQVAQIFLKYDLATLPVVSAEGALLGRITFDDVHDVLEEEASEDIMAMAGASPEELVYGSEFFRIALFRLPWLVFSLIGVLLIPPIVLFFSEMPANAVVLAAFVPVVMAMTGNVGSQSAMIITRGFAIGKVEVGNIGRAVIRELAVGVIMGLAAGVLVGLYARVWKGDLQLGVTLGTSMICSMTAATGVGVLAPALFKKLGVDPAIAAGPLVTTSCDLIGVTIYLFVAIAMLA